MAPVTRSQNRAQGAVAQRMTLHEQRRALLRSKITNNVGRVVYDYTNKFPTKIRCNDTPLGMYNRHVDCFRHAPIQAILHFPSFLNWLKAHNDSHNQPRENCLACRLFHLAVAIWTGETADPVPFHTICDTTAAQLSLAPDWTQGGQQESRDFMQWLLRHLRFGMPPQNPQTPYQPSLHFQALFEMRTESSWTCARCDTTHRRSNVDEYDSYCPTLPVPAQDSAPLNDLINDFFNEEMQRTCPTCETHGEDGDGSTPIRQVKKKVVTFPDILVLCLGRQFWGKRGPIKRLTKIIYPDLLDLTKFAAIRGKFRYRLRSVVAHIGPLVAGGHYVAYARARKHVHLISDDKLETGEKINLLELKGDNDAVMLFYNLVTR